MFSIDQMSSGDAFALIQRLPSAKFIASQLALLAAGVAGSFF
jgi:hypothetical protein